MRLFKVNLIESEKGWGRKSFDTKYFIKENNAISYIKEYNSKNNLKITPDYYTFAEFIGLEEVVNTFKLEYAEDFNEIE